MFFFKVILTAVITQITKKGPKSDARLSEFDWLIFFGHKYFRNQ